jgi:hypothetical protein
VQQWSHCLKKKKKKIIGKLKVDKKFDRASEIKIWCKKPDEKDRDCLEIPNHNLLV